MRARAPYLLQDFAPSISARRLKKSFARGLARAARRTLAIDEIDLDLRPGEILGIAGGESAGKTTLLQCLCGLLRPDSGSLELFGERLDAGICPPQVAYVPAVPVYYPFLSVMDVLELRLARNLFSPRRESLVDRSLSLLDLGSVAGCRIGALPKDVLRRVALAEAFVGGPDVVLADTNASDLMPPFSSAALSALEQHAAEGCTAVVASREVASIASVANRILLLDSGRIVRTFAIESYGEPIIPDTFPPVGKRFVAERVH